MKKKVLYGLTLALFGSVSMGTLQSCKDDLSDYVHQNAFDHKDFSEQIAAIHRELDPLVGPNGKVQKYYDELTDSIEALRKDIIKNQKELQDQIKDSLNVSGAATQVKLDSLQNNLTELSTKMESLVTTDALGQQVNNLDSLLRVYADSVATARSSAMKVILEQRIEREVATLNTTINNVDSVLRVKISGLDKKIDDHITSYENHLTDYNKLVLRVDTLEMNYKLHEAAIAAANNEINQLWLALNGPGGVQEQIAMVYGALTDGLDELGGKYDALENEHNMLVEQIFGDGGLRDQMSQYANALREEFTAADEELWLALQARDEEMTQFWNSLRAEFAEADEEIWLHMEELRNEMSMYYFASENAINELKAEDEEIWNYIQGPNGIMEQMTMIINRFSGDVNRIDAQLSQLDNQYKNLLRRANALITGILIQGTDNPIFGNFSLPLGIKSNLLFNWYGENNGYEFNFPSASNTVSYDTELPVLTAEDLTFLGVTKEEIKNGLLGEVDLGRLYLTVNPVGHDFDNTALKLETTNGEALPYQLKVKKSNEKLYWGYSRGADDNGFYAADVVMPATYAAVNASKIQIEDGLKTAAKDLLKDRTKRNAVNMLKALYSQMSNMLPAYGVRYDWTVDNKPYAVLSNYDLAVATAKPLSYSFLYGKSITKHLPTFGHIDNIFDKLIDKDKLNIKIPQNFHVDGFNFEFTGMDITLSANPDITYNESIVVTVPGFTVEADDNYDGKITVVIPDQTATLTPDQLSGLIDAIKNGFTSAIDQMNVELKDQLNKQIRDEIVNKLTAQVNEMLKNIEQSVNDMLADLEGQINVQISDILDDIMSSITDKTGPLFNRVNQAIDVYNKVAGKINNILEDPNHYLQVAMFYKGNGTVGLLSNNKLDPTPFKNAGGNAISLYASSYSAEILAPAYLKYIAVSNVYDANGNEVKAEKANIAEINKASGLNKVFPGVTKRVGVAASKLKKDLVYEIVYQGVDYSGKTSTQKFYITVK